MHDDIDGLRGRFNVYLNKMKAEIRAVCREAGEFIEIYMVEFISSRPARTSHLNHPGSPGRIDTGYMVQAIGSKVAGNAGWAAVDAGYIKNWADYFGYQEEGFTHLHAGHVPGMFAFHDAWAAVQPDLIHDIRRVVNG